MNNISRCVLMFVILVNSSQVDCDEVPIWDMPLEDLMDIPAGPNTDTSTLEEILSNPDLATYSVSMNSNDTVTLGLVNYNGDVYGEATIMNNGNIYVTSVPLTPYYQWYQADVVDVNPY